MTSPTLLSAGIYQDTEQPMQGAALGTQEHQEEAFAIGWVGGNGAGS